MGPLYYFIYTSYIATDFPPAEVAALVRAAAAVNSRRDLTGVLIFDGLRFCQYLEGPAESLGRMLTAISHDPRHVGFRVKEHVLLLRQQRRFAGWPMAFCQLDSQSSALDEFDRLNNRSAASVLDALRSTIELRPPVGNSVEYRRVEVGDQPTAGQDAGPQQQRQGG